MFEGIQNRMSNITFSDAYAWFQAIVPILMFPFLVFLLLLELIQDSSYLNTEVIILILIILFLPFVPYLTEFEIFGAKGSFDDPEFTTTKESTEEAAPSSAEGSAPPDEDEII